MKNKIRRLMKLWPLLLLTAVAFLVLVQSVQTIMQSSLSPVMVLSTDEDASPSGSVQQNASPDSPAALGTGKSPEFFSDESAMQPSSADPPTSSVVGSPSEDDISVLDIPDSIKSGESASAAPAQYHTTETETVYQFSSNYAQIEEGFNNTLAIETQILCLINNEREKAGIPALIFDSFLSNSASIRARELPRSFSHTRPDGSDCFSSFPAGYVYMGENLAEANGIISDSNFASGCVTYWMESPGHRENIMNPGFLYTGIGVHIITGHMYAVQHFGGTGS